MIYIQIMNILKWLFSFFDKSIYIGETKKSIERIPENNIDEKHPYEVAVKEVKVKKINIVE
jgi:hypothetical protein